MATMSARERGQQGVWLVAGAAFGSHWVRQEWKQDKVAQTWSEVDQRRYDWLVTRSRQWTHTTSRVGFVCAPALVIRTRAG